MTIKIPEELEEAFVELYYSIGDWRADTNTEQQDAVADILERAVLEYCGQHPDKYKVW